MSPTPRASNHGGSTWKNTEISTSYPSRGHGQTENLFLRIVCLCFMDKPVVSAFEGQSGDVGLRRGGKKIENTLKSYFTIHDTEL